MGIDCRLFPIKLHYFLRFMGTGPLTVFLPVIATQMGVPAKIVGYIWAVLPFFSLVAKTSAGAIADRTRSHRAVFLGGLLLMVTSLSALYFVPDIPNSSLPSSSSSSSDTLNFSSSPLISFPTTSTTHELLLSSNSSNVSFVSSRASVTFSESSVEVAEGSTATPLPESVSLPTEDGSDKSLVKRYEFWVLFLCLLGQYCGHVIVITMQETVCFQLLGEERQKYGQQRVWGTIGIGLSAILSGAFVDLYNEGSDHKDYLPAHIFTAVFLLLDICLVARLQFPRPERRMTSSALQGALWRPHVVLVLVTVSMVGVMVGLLWTFEFILVQEVALKWDPHFSHLRLLLGLLMGVQCFLAEVPFFMVAGRIIQKLGHANALFASLLGFMVRLVLYSVVSNPWWFLPVDLLHGISFAISYPCFLSYASSVAPKGGEATTQGIFGATFFGSTGVGGLVGGWLFGAKGGPQTFWLMGLAVGVYSILFLAAHYAINRLTRATGKVSRVLAAEETEADKAVIRDEKYVEEKEKENGQEVKMDLIEIREPKKGDRNSVRAVSYRRTMDFD